MRPPKCMIGLKIRTPSEPRWNGPCAGATGPVSRAVLPIGATASMKAIPAGV